MLRTMQKRLRVSDSVIEETMKNIDRDGDGTVNLAEYYLSQRGKTHQDLLHRALVHRSGIRKEFQRFDMDNSGYVTEDELLEVIRARGAKFSIEQVQKTVQETDRNDDGKLDYEEFVVLMTK